MVHKYLGTVPNLVKIAFFPPSNVKPKTCPFVVFIAVILCICQVKQVAI
jgi:hypothetical protein